MPKRNVVILDIPTSPWCDYFREFFEETSTTIHLFHEGKDASLCLDQMRPDAIFVNPVFLSPPLTQKLKVLRQSCPGLRIFEIRPRIKTKDASAVAPAPTPGLEFDDFFDDLLPAVEFQKKICQSLPMPESVRVLLIDDEDEISAMVHEFLDGRTHPAFQILHVENGKKGLDAIAKFSPDVIVLDIKMPVMDGREAYREIKKREIKIPVIIFFDAISGDEMIEIHKFGRPAVVEKGARQSAMPELMSLIKKVSFFG